MCGVGGVGGGRGADIGPPPPSHSGGSRFTHISVFQSTNILLPMSII